MLSAVMSKSKAMSRTPGREREENQIEALREAELKLKRYRTMLRLTGTEIENRNRVIRSLTAFTYQASRLTEPSALFKLALNLALDTAKAHSGAIILIDQDSKALTMGAHRELTPDLVHILTGRQLDIAARALMPHLVEGKGALLELNQEFDEGETALLEAGQVNSLASLPLQAGHQMLGALVIGIRDRARFRPAELHGLLAIAQETAAAWQSLQLREKLWQMAETLLSQGSENGVLASSAGVVDETVARPSLPSVQGKLANMVADLGGNMAAIFALEKTGESVQANLVLDYGLSPMFVGTYSPGMKADTLFPFEQLARHNLLVRNIHQANNSLTIPLLISLEEEGARSLLGLHLGASGPNPTQKAIFVASTNPGAFTMDHIDRLLPAANSLLPLITELPPLPTLPTRSVHAPPLERQATDDDMELLLAGMMAAEEEVERHNADFAALNNIAELLNSTLDLAQVVDEILERIQDVLGTECVWLYLIDPGSYEPTMMELQAQLGLSARYARGMRRLAVGDSLEGAAAKENKTYFINDTQEASNRCHLLIQVEDIQSVAAVPLACPDELNGQDHKRVVGVLSVAFRDFHVWQPRQIRLLTSIVGQLAFAVNNAQLYRQVQEGMTSLTISNDVLKQINSLLVSGSQSGKENTQ
jgi:GAF domain-containing protein